MNLNAFAIGVTASALFGIVIGLFIGHSLYYKPVAKETPAFAVTQRDGSQILKRDPDAKAKPAQEIPKGATVERIVKVIVKAKPEAAPTIPRTSSKWSEPSASAAAATPVDVAADCPPVNLDLSLVRMPDETRRVIVSSQNGDVLDGIDIPVEAAKPTSDEKKWSVGGTYFTNKIWAARVGRDIGPVTVSGEVLKFGRDEYFGVGGVLRF